MFKKLASNYNLSNILCKTLFVITFAFCNWQNFMFASNVILENNNVVVAVLSALLSGVVMAFLLPVVTNLFLNVLRLYNVPRAEYALIAQFFCVIGFFLCGLFNAINFFTPILLGWGSVIFPFLVSFCCVFAFYKITAKMYFNDVTVAYYFRAIAVVYLVMTLVMEVL